MTVTTRSEKETYRLAARVASKLRGREVIGLIGDLGTGKTTFVRGLARTLGIRGVVRSPTFTLLHVYNIKRHPNIKHLVHVDAYRLRSARELAGIGIEEYLGGADTVTIIEWADRVRPLLTRAPKAIIIHCSHGKGPTERHFAVERISFRRINQGGRP